jgi:hypothetical protein
VNRARRNTTNPTIGSNDFDDYQQFMPIEEMLVKFKNDIKESSTKFDTIMELYIQVLGNNAIFPKVKNTLLKILEKAVINQSNESIDNDMFMSLNSYILRRSNEINQASQLLLDGLLQKFNRTINENKMATTLKRSFLDVVKNQSISQINKSGAQIINDSATNDEATNDENTQQDEHGNILHPTTKQNASYSGPAAAPATVVVERHVPQKKSDNIVVEGPVESPVKKMGSLSDEEASTKETSPSLKRNKSADRVDSKKSKLNTSSSDSDEETVMIEEGNGGGSRKNHTPQSHKSATRRKNKNSLKRKTIKKRKMPKRKNNTRRNK